MKKVLLSFLVAIILLSCCSSTVFAIEDTDSMYEAQIEASGAEKIIDSLPENSKKALSDMGIESIDWKKINEISFWDFLSSILTVANDTLKSAGIPAFSLIGIMVLCALADGVRTASLATVSSEIISITGTLCICAATVVPLTQIIDEATRVISSSSDFMLIYIPVMAGLMLSAGQTLSGGTYYSVMMMASQGVAQISSKVIAPLLNIFLGVSIVSSISPGIRFNGICSLFSKTIRFVLGFAMSIFTALLTIQGIISSSADSVSGRAIRFAVRSFVPVVGSALSDAYLSVQGCVKLLKSGIGIVAMIGTAFIYLPVLCKCLLWLFMLNICASVGEIFSLKAPCSLLNACARVLSTMVAVLLCCMAVFIISTAIMLIIGGN